jgi:excisionase family DNA binding protein
MVSLLTTQQAADALGLHRRTILKYIQRGLIQAVKFGRDWQIDPVEVERYQQERRKPGRPSKD